MKQNAIVTAPQLEDIEAAFSLWKEDHFGTHADFYDFMVTPTAAREEFLRRLRMRDPVIMGNIVPTTFFI